MKVEALKKERIEDFKEYCRKHRLEVDDSYLHEDEDFLDFEPNAENPTYIIINQQEEIIAAASLIINDYFRRGKMGRFRIFHSEIADAECYKMLFQAILKHAEGLDKVFLHIPIVNKELIGLIEGLNFSIERYSYRLIREDLAVPEPNFPEGYEVRSFKLGNDEETWCEIRNTSFAKLKGSKTPITSEMVVKMMSDVDHIEGGAMILYHGERPVGVVRGTTDDSEGSRVMCIGPLAILPEYQGKGLGRSLLRASLNFARENSYERTILSVNAENERAKALYLQEGFKQVEAVVCYKYDLINNKRP
ncbi:MAG: GNAT family N-acetyltransferase [Clostridia bacterium]